jgi:hypothetical protein
MRTAQIIAESTFIISTPLLAMSSYISSGLSPAFEMNNNSRYRQSDIAVSRDIMLSYSDKLPFCCVNIRKKSD